MIEAVPDSAALRARMVERQIEGRGISDPRLLAAMRTVPREAFVPAPLRKAAYDDLPLPIPEGQTISQPYIVASMIAAASVRRGDRVLDVGTGSGYSAAVLAEMGAEVFTIERHEGLASAARERIANLGHHAVAARTGDGTLGWPEAAPFDAILVAAGGPVVPGTLIEQLAPGGRLVMPVGEQPRRQTLVRVTRDADGRLNEERLEEVVFVPLIGAEGWTADEKRPTNLPGLIRNAAEVLPPIEAEDFAAAFDRFGDRRVVLLGEASHGTAEFYRARAAITRRLIEMHGFTIVAVEADWPDAASIDRFVRDRPTNEGGEPPFRRFPSWMWRNTEVEAFVRWLHRRNMELPAGQRAGFFGLDLYSLSASMTAVLDYLASTDPEAAVLARQRYGCLMRWSRDPAAYGRQVLHGRYDDCEDQVVAQLRDLLGRSLPGADGDPDARLDAAQNARLVASAERYYRIMYHGGAESWNLRDTHMFETLEHLLDAHGPDAKAVVWAHNSHIGDARATEMGRRRGELNIGQLCRGRWGKQAALIGFGTHEGTVAAASDWDEDMEVKSVLPSRSDSYERLCHDAGLPSFLLDLGAHRNAAVRQALLAPRLERFIGVIYRPDTEFFSHYAEAVLPEQFDAYVWFDRTSAVTPLDTHSRPGAPETWPFGV